MRLRASAKRKTADGGLSFEGSCRDQYNCRLIQ
jgi:hypothetical protein